MKFIWAEKRRKTALPPPKNTNNSLTPPLWAINNKDMKSKEEILDKYLKDNHGPAETYRDILKAMKEYAQQSQPSGMRWVRASDPPKNSNPVYIRYKHAEGYAKTLGRYCNGVWEWCDTEIEAIYPEFVLTLEWLDESSPAGAAEGATRCARVVSIRASSSFSESWETSLPMISWNGTSE